jgi:argininosuccinate lyase
VDASLVRHLWAAFNLAPPSTKLWVLTSRMTGGIDPLMHQYNASISYDSHLYKEDILGSIAFARANAKSGIISNDDFAEIERGLHEVLKEWEADTFVIKSNDEDVSHYFTSLATRFIMAKVMDLDSYC